MGNIARRIIAQTGLQFAGKTIGIALGVAAIAIITRSLGQEGFGKYATIMAYLQFFGIAVDLGLNVIAPTTLAQLTQGAPERDAQRVFADARRFFSNVFTMRLVVAVVVFAVAAVIALLIPAYDTSIRIGIAIATFSFLAIVLTQILTTPFQVATDMRWPVVAEVVGRLVVVIGVACAWWYHLGLWGMVIATTTANVVAMFVLLAVTMHRFPFHLAFDCTVWRAVLARSWPIGLSILFNLVYLRADVVILSLLRSHADVGLYAAPYRLLDVLTQFPHLAMGLVLPMLAASWAAANRAQFAERMQRAFDGLAFIGIPLAVGAIVLGTPLMVLVAGNAFAASGPILAVLALALLGIFLGQPFGYAVVAVGAQRQMLWGYAMVAVATLAGYLLLIPRYSYWGAAWMTVMSEVVVAVITYLVVRRATGLQLSWRVVLGSLVASAGMAGALLAVPLPIVPRIALGVITYGGLALAFPPTRRLVMAVRTP